MRWGTHSYLKMRVDKAEWLAGLRTEVVARGGQNSSPELLPQWRDLVVLVLVDLMQKKTRKKSGRGTVSWEEGWEEKERATMTVLAGIQRR